MLKVAIVGSGIIGRNHAEAIQRHPGLEVAALVDTVPAANEALSAHLGGVPSFTNLADALDGVDIVAVCTPSGTHADVAEEALRAGRHVVIEKPLDVSLPRARLLAGIAAAAAERGLVCSVVSQHRFDPASVAVREAVDAGRLGRLTSAVASVAWWRTQDYYDSAGWRGTHALDGGGALINQAVHTLDLLLWLFGEPVEVAAHAARLAHDRIEVEDVITASIRFASGALAVLHATTAAYPGLSARLQVHGTGGSAIIDDDGLVYLGDAPVIPEPKPADAFVVGHLRQWEDIADAVEKGRPPGIGVADGLAALEAVRAVYLSAALGRPIALADVRAGAHD